MVQGTLQWTLDVLLGSPFSRLLSVDPVLTRHAGRLGTVRLPREVVLLSDAHALPVALPRRRSSRTLGGMQPATAPTGTTTVHRSACRWTELPGVATGITTPSLGGPCTRPEPTG